MGCCQNAGESHHIVNQELQPTPNPHHNNYSQLLIPNSLPLISQPSSSNHTISYRSIPPQNQVSSHSLKAPPPSIPEEDEMDMLRCTHSEHGTEVNVGLARQKRTEHKVNSLMQQQAHKFPPNASYPANSKIKFGALSAINQVESNIDISHQRGSNIDGSNNKIGSFIQDRQGSNVFDRQSSINNDRSDRGSMVFINTSTSSIRASRN